MAGIIRDTDTRKRLFDAAARIFARKGFEKTTVDEIAEAAEVAKGTIYYHFKSKEELFLFLVEEGIDILRLKISAALKDSPGIREGIAKMISAHLDFFEEYQELCLILLSEAWGISARQEKLQSMLSRYYAAVGAVIERGTEQQAIRPQDKEVLCASLFGMTVMVAQHFLRKKDPDRWQEVKEQVVALFFKGAVVPA